MRFGARVFLCSPAAAFGFREIHAEPQAHRRFGNLIPLGPLGLQSLALGLHLRWQISDSSRWQRNNKESSSRSGGLDANCTPVALHDSLGQ